MTNPENKEAADRALDHGDPINRKYFPSNAHSRKKEEEDIETPRVKKVIKGRARTRKKSLSKKFSETFLSEEVPSVSSYILHDVLIPALKDLVYNMITGSAEMSLFGDSRGSRTRREGGKSYVSYSNYYNKDDRGRGRRDNKSNLSRNNRARHNFDDIVLDTRGEAEEVLSHLVDLTEDYGVASVADLYDLVGVTSHFTDNKYGWTNLANASVSRVRDGYLIDLPRPQELD